MSVVKVIIENPVSFAAMPNAFQEVGMDALKAATEMVAGTAQENAPVDRTFFRAGIHALPTAVSPFLLVGEVGTSGVQYASVIEMVDPEGNPVEFGRRPDKPPPPIQVIQDWVERKGLADTVSPTTGKKMTSKAIAWAIAISIGKRGLPREGDDRFAPIRRARQQHAAEVERIFTVDVPARLKERLGA